MKRCGIYREFHSQAASNYYQLAACALQAFSRLLCEFLQLSVSLRPFAERLRVITDNMELSLQWLESERAVMDDVHVKAGWFLTYPNGTVFDTKQHVQQSTVNMSEWIIDWRNQDAADYFVGAILNSVGTHATCSFF